MTIYIQDTAITGMYRRHHSELNEFTEGLESAGTADHIVIGDFNCDLAQPRNREEHEIVAALSQLDMVVLPKDRAHTRRPRHTCQQTTNIDHVVARHSFTSQVSDATVVAVDQSISDHDWVTAIVQIEEPTEVARRPRWRVGAFSRENKREQFAAQSDQLISQRQLAACQPTNQAECTEWYTGINRALLDALEGTVGQATGQQQDTLGVPLADIQDLALIQMAESW